MKKSNHMDNQILKSIDEKIRYVNNLINYNSNSELKFLNKEVYHEIVTFYKEILELMSKVVGDSEHTKDVYSAIAEIQEVIDINSEHYER